MSIISAVASFDIIPSVGLERFGFDTQIDLQVMYPNSLPTIQSHLVGNEDSI